MFVDSINVFNWLGVRIPALNTNIIFEKNVFEILEHLLYMFDSFSARTKVHVLRHEKHVQLTWSWWSWKLGWGHKIQSLILAWSKSIQCVKIHIQWFKLEGKKLHQRWL